LGSWAHLLAWRQVTLYASDEDLVFPSLRAKGTKPPAANMLVADYLRVAAKKAGVVAPPRTFGFHTFRRTLASVLVKMKVDPKLVQEMLRRQNLKTTLEVYAKAVTEDKLEAQGMFLELLFRGRKAAEPDPVKVNCFEMRWPGTELNRPRQPFSGLRSTGLTAFSINNLTHQSGQFIVATL
jgi:hypothetical protein